jgi:hypothetical protein
MGTTHIVRYADGTYPPKRVRAALAVAHSQREIAAREAAFAALPVAPKPAHRLVQMGVSDLRIGDYLADKRTRIAAKITLVEGAVEEGKLTIVTTKGASVMNVTRVVSVLIP